MSEAAQEPGGEGALTEWLLRVFAVAFYGWAVLGIGGAWWADTSRWSMLGLLLAEGYTLALVVTARRASVRDFTPLSVAATMYAAFFFVLLRTDTIRFVPELVGVGIIALGLSWEVYSKVTLGRSFGLLPAHRKVVLGGPYRVVRHPIYFGYLVHNTGWLLTNFHWFNVVILATLLLVQVYRIQREELVLSQQPDYREYQGQVRWRLVPFVW
jgi:protein-S-isoprenylcysteine O-methyltransferase Ste14